jgi:4-alpha-glucanotransferase
MPHDDGSPYQCMSAHGGNIGLISGAKLIAAGWLEATQLNEKNYLDLAYDGFITKASEQQKQEFAGFCDTHAWWLDDFALYLLWKHKFAGKGWYAWPEPYQNRDDALIKSAQVTDSRAIDSHKFQQFVFFQQWAELKAYAHHHGVLLFGDIPIFVAYDSADVWAERTNFKLNADGSMPVVAGVPPDYFSATGQRWGNPHFNWEYLRNNGFDWWLRRIQTQLQLFDILRIDHFRGLEAAWEIPVTEDTAINGEWVKAPGQLLLNKIHQHFGYIALVAEDLGVITPEVEALRDDFSLPGMKVLQFGFSNDPHNPHEPHNCSRHSVIYTGTHDNDTTLGWYQQLNERQRYSVDNYLSNPDIAMPDALINCALASVARMAILPLQDVLGLDGEHRMNVPGTTEGNWSWRFSWDQLSDQRIENLREKVVLYGRL